MTPDTSLSSSRPSSPPVFVTTHWSVVLHAARADTTRARDALAHLCQIYWYPLYAHVRRRGYGPEDAQDLTQTFFAHLLERQALAAADPTRGRFRTFLLATMNNFLVSEWRKARAQKRSPEAPLVSLDWAAAEERFDLEPVDAATPDKAFEKQWALELLESVLNQLEEEYRRQDKATLFAALKRTLTGSRETQPYDELAASLGLTEGTVKVTVHRLRKRYRELIRAEIANTVASPEEVDGEMRHLLQALAER